MMKSIKQSLDDSSKNKLSRMGYSVDYSTTLSSLYNPIQKTRKTSFNNSDSLLHTSSYSEYYATILGDGSDALKGDFINGFVNEISLQQGVCIIKPWLSFPITAKSTRGEQVNYNVSVESPNDLGILNGNTLCGSSTTIKSKMDKEYLTAFRGENGDFIIGVGVDLDNFGPKYFQHFYNDEATKWAEKACTNTNLKKLAEKKLLFAEITLDIDGGKILNAPVVMSTSDPIINNVRRFALWIPCPLLCTNRYSSLGTVVFNAPNKKTTTIGNENTSYPFLNAGYDHKKAIIRGLNTSFYESITQRTDGEKNLESVRVDWKINGNSPDKLARVRLYFDETRKDEIESILNMEIPESGARVFGPLKEVATEKLVDTSSSYQYEGIEEIYWEDGMCPTGITRQQYEKCLRIIWTFEKSTKTFKCNNPVVNNWGSNLNEDFISYGVMQYIERPRNARISALLLMYEEVCKESGKPYDAILLSNAKRISNHRSGVRGLSSIPSEIVHALEELWKDPRMWYAMTKRYATSKPRDNISDKSDSYKDYYSSLYGALDLYRSLNFTSAFGLLLCMDLRNQGMMGIKLNEVKSLSSEYDRIMKLCQQRINMGSHYKRKYLIIKRNLEASRNDLSLTAPLPWHSNISV